MPSILEVDLDFFSFISKFINNKCGAIDSIKKACESEFPYCFITDFAKFFLYVAWFWVLHRGSFVDTPNFQNLM